MTFRVAAGLRCICWRTTGKPMLALGDHLQLLLLLVQLGEHRLLLRPALRSFQLLELRWGHVALRSRHTTGGQLAERRDMVR